MKCLLDLLAITQLEAVYISVFAPLLCFLGLRQFYKFVMWLRKG